MRPRSAPTAVRRDGLSTASTLGVALLLTALLPSAAHAYSTGIAGYSSNPSAAHGSGSTCVSCHNAAVYNYTSSFSGTTTVAPSGTTTLTFNLNKVSGGSAVDGGLNVSVTSGSLTNGAGSRITTLGGDGIAGELTHTGPKATNGSGNVSWSFTFNAPSSVGSVTIYGCGNPVDNSGDNTGDGDAACTSQSLTVNSTPSANNDSPSVAENSSNNTLSVLANDFSGAGNANDSGDSITIQSVGATNHGGSVSISGGSTSLKYTPANHFFGTETFTYTIVDSIGATATATVSVTVPQTAPTANGDTYNNVSENTLYAGSSVLANDTDPSGTPTATLVTDVSHGVLSLNSNGTFSYTPTLHYVGADSFVYKACHGAVCSTNATASLTVNRVAPTAVADSYNVTQNTVLNVTAGSGVLANDTDPSGLAMTAVLVTGPAHSSAFSLNADGSFSYTPAHAYHGGDSFTYKANDGFLNSSTVTVSLSIGQSPPTAVADSYSVNENATLNVNAASGVLANDTDPSALHLTAVLVTDVSHGTLTLNANGSFHYTPNAQYFGADSFTYHATDGAALNSNTVTVSLTVNQLAPTAHPDTYTVTENASLSVNAASGVLANDIDPSGTPTAVQVTAPGHSSAFILNSDGSFSYTPTMGFFGNDSFTYKACHGALCSAAATVTLRVTQLAPTANADSYGTTEGQVLTVSAPGVLGNDTDPSNLPLTAVLASNVSHGSLALNSDGSFTYTPANKYFGGDSFTYKASNGTLKSAPVTVSLTVTNAPTVKAPPDVSINSTGYLTAVTLGTATATDPVDGTLTVTADHQSGDYRPGHYLVTYSATNAAHVTTTATQTVDVIPLVEFGPDQVSGENHTVNLTVMLNGPAAAYPVTVNYSAGGTAPASASNAASGSVQIASGTEASIPIAINTVSTSGTVTLTITSVTNAVADTRKTGTITIATADVAPTATLYATQAAQQRTLVFANDGTVTLNAGVMDPNANDTISYDWSGSDAGLKLAGTSSVSPTFNPSGLAASNGRTAHYTVQLKLTDKKGNASTSRLDVGIQAGSASAPDGQPLSNTTDSNGNGVPDATDGVGDSNNNGIPDYMDPVTDAFALPDETGTLNSARIIEADTGLQLSLGTLAQGEAVFATPPAYPLYLASPILKTVPQPADSGMTNVGGVFDIDVTGLAPGASFNIVLPLRTAVEKGAVFRLYSSAGGWYSFTTSTAAAAKHGSATATVSTTDALASTSSVNGQCPAPNSSSYKKGLQPFTDCVRLTLTDGGINDSDGKADGAVTVLGGVAVTTPVSSSSASGPGGAIDPSTLALLAILAASRRRNRHSGGRDSWH